MKRFLSIFDKYFIKAYDLFFSQNLEYYWFNLVIRSEKFLNTNTLRINFEIKMTLKLNNNFSN